MTFFSLTIVAVLVVLVTAKCKQSITEIFILITALGIALEIMMSVGYFLRVGSIELGYSEFIIILDTLIALLMFAYKKPARRHVLLMLGFIIACCISLILQMIVPYAKPVVSSSAEWDFYYFLGQQPSQIVIGMQHIKEIFHVVCYTLIMMQVQLLDPEKKSKLIRHIYSFEKPFIWFGVIEFIAVKILDVQTILTSLEIYILGDSYISDGAMLSIGISDRLRGLKSEPSMYGFALFIFFVQAYFMYREYQKNEYIRYAIAALLLMIASFSFTAIVCLAGIVGYWLILKYKNGSFITQRKIIGCTCVCIVMVIVALNYIYSHEFSNYYLKRIHMALINMEDLSITGWRGDYATYDGSTKIRMISIIGTLQYFLARPLFGLALGSTYAHSTMATVLASLGIVGTSFWCRFTFYADKKNNGRIYTISVIVWILMLIILGEGLFPFYGIENVVVLYVFDRFKKGRKIDGTQNINNYSML